MLAAYASAINPNDPLSGLAVGARIVARQPWHNELHTLKRTS